jgi:hypothetical protein
MRICVIRLSKGVSSGGERVALGVIGVELCALSSLKWQEEKSASVCIMK